MILRGFYSHFRGRPSLALQSDENYAGAHQEHAPQARQQRSLNRVPPMSTLNTRLRCFRAPTYAAGVYFRPTDKARVLMARQAPVSSHFP
jgi:hypothetical protein